MQSSDAGLSSASLSRVTDDIWIVDDAPINAAGLRLPVRMTVIRLSNGDLVLHSPVRHAPELRDELERLGTIKYLLAPNIAHWMFLPDWQRALPHALTFAARGLSARRQVRAAGLRVDRELTDTTPEEWAADLETVSVNAPMFSELALFDRRSRTLVLTDLVQNLDPAISVRRTRRRQTCSASPSLTARPRPICVSCCGSAAVRSRTRPSGWCGSPPNG